MAQGRIRDCHGDVHSAHVCFTNGICIFDCIEFNERFRYADACSEVAFLAMDIDFHGHPELSEYFIDAYVNRSGDNDLLPLLNFYKSYRAYVRGKVESFKLDDPMISEAEKKRALEAAQKYFDLAHSYIGAQRAALFITTGLIGTGKSTLTQALAERLDIPVISSDIIRKGLAGIPTMEHRFEEVRSGIYSEDFTKKTYDELFRQAGERLSQGRSVIIDAAFGRAEERRKAMALAREKGADFWLLECVCADETIVERLERRMQEESPSDGRLEIFADLKKAYERVTEVPEANHLIIDTSVAPEEMIVQVFARMKKE
jgi:predicted kinase